MAVLQVATPEPAPTIMAPVQEPTTAPTAVMATVHAAPSPLGHAKPRPRAQKKPSSLATPSWEVLEKKFNLQKLPHSGIPQSRGTHMRAKEILFIPRDL
jgi:hypothetical protein